MIESALHNELNAWLKVQTMKHMIGSELQIELKKWLNVHLILNWLKASQM